jgi:peptide/nickel transport system permease protein
MSSAILTPTADSSGGGYVGRPRRGVVRTLLTFARQYPLGAAGAVVLFTIVVCALLAPVIATHDPLEITADISQGPGAHHWFGTDRFGRDVFSRTVYGARVSLWVGAVSLAIGIGGGSAIGLISGYFGGKVDTVIQAITDSLLAIPWLVLAMSIVAVTGNSTTNVMVAVGIIFLPGTVRVVRSAVLGVKQELYVESARSSGAASPRILARHVLPNVMAPVLVLLTIGLGNAIVAEASLSFLGLGSPPPTASWGRDLAESRSSWLIASHTFWPPVLSIVAAVFSFNFLGDAVRDALDPRLRGR